MLHLVSREAGPSPGLKRCAVATLIASAQFECSCAAARP